MPTRLLRDWTDSDSVCPISAFAERLFVRLIMKADDYGRFHGDARRIRSACFPLLVDAVADDDVTGWLHELAKAGLVELYQVDHKQLLQIPNFGQRMRNTVPKFAAPGDTSAHVCRDLPQVAAGGGQPRPEAHSEAHAHSEAQNPLSPPSKGGTDSASLPIQTQKRKRARTPEEKAARALGLEVQ